MPPRLNAAQRRQAAADALELTDEERQQIVQARIDNEARDAEARRVLEAELARERHQAEQARAERITAGCSLESWCASPWCRGWRIRPCSCTPGRS